MRSPWWKTRNGRSLLVFGATFLVLVTVGFAGMRLVPGLEFARQEVPAMRQPDPSWVPVFFRGGTQLDHAIVWNDIGSAMDHARSADVLFFGTSQMQFGLPTHELRAFERRTGLSAYSLGLPFAEGSVFARGLIEKFDLRPRVAVVNVTAFFRDDESLVASQARDESYWRAVTTVWEERLAALAWPVASDVFPSFVTARPSQTLLRSTTDGTWLPMRWPHLHVPVAEAPEPMRWGTRAAIRFRNALALRGIALVLVCVPSPEASCSPEALRPLALLMGARMVIPKLDTPLWTGDFAHLCPLSGKRYSRAMLRELERVDVVRTIRRRPKPARAGVRT
jgi:hypothetical protein